MSTSPAAVVMLAPPAGSAMWRCAWFERAAELHNSLRTGSDGAKAGDRGSAADDDAVGRGGADVGGGGAGDGLRMGGPAEGAGHGVPALATRAGC